ncbi:uncharacterized protein B0I36DRAFT_353858 [Microdochium trichocladiopsis]|uniref:Fungal specific transcription factor n=1 Tax=Microdochium trichocladiopsis TaxID=1682393 RepID=A0A9P8XZ26_9PEZI|nr:uncharacterized protein B0I36DRAFT_353858 [Microdochium trichocladiopsis]KAH7021159.1 hypothetical protein B0I36DRAFT_353858 [Microdochium trichocladiopsis]
MSSSSSPSSGSAATNNNDDTTASNATATKQPLPLPEPPKGSGATQLAVDGEGVKLDHLGPLVVNVDGTMSRIGNWDKMAPIERENTLRIIGKRNQARLATLRAAAEKVAATASDSSSDTTTTEKK